MLGKGNNECKIKIEDYRKENGKKSHIIFALEINTIKKLFGLFQFQLNMRNTSEEYI